MYLLVLFLLSNKMIHFGLNVQRTMHFNVADAAIQGYLQSESLWDAQCNVGTAQQCIMELYLLRLRRIQTSKGKLWQRNNASSRFSGTVYR